MVGVGRLETSTHLLWRRMWWDLRLEVPLTAKPSFPSFCCWHLLLQ